MGKGGGRLFVAQVCFSISKMAALACEQSSPIVLSQNFWPKMYSCISHGKDDDKSRTNKTRIRKRSGLRIRILHPTEM